MPNVRAKNKCFFGGFIEKGFLKVLTSIAKKRRPNDRFGFAMEMTRKGLAQEGIHVPEPIPTIPSRIIQDELRNLPIPPWKKAYLRKKKRKQCVSCSRKAEPGYSYCLVHLRKMRKRDEQYRKRRQRSRSSQK